MTHTSLDSTETDILPVAPETLLLKLSPEPQPKPAAKELYPVVWRWHFYAGLLTAPLLWIITLTGALYVFRLELTNLRDQHLLEVTPQSERKSYEELRRIAADVHGSDDFEAVVVYPDPARSIQFVAHDETEGEGHAERHKYIHMNPYTGEVLGTQFPDEDFFSIVLELHRSLMLGSTGRVLTELVTCWGLVLLATGVFLWWPRGKKNVGVWLPRVKGKLYAVLRDWHAVPGFYMVPLMVLVAGTGLFFTLVWGTGFNTTVKKVGHWAPEWFQDPKSTRPTPDAKPASLDVVVPTFLARARPGDKVPIRFATNPELSHRAFMILGDDKNTYRAVAVDQYSGKLMGISDSTEQPFMYRVRLWAVSIHMGQIFGLTTQILALLASLVLFALSFTGIWMWWKRKPKGRSGFPRRPAARSMPVWGWGVILLVGLILPVAGVSFLLVMGIDILVARFMKSPKVETSAA